MANCYEEIVFRLKEIAEVDYKIFNAKIVNTSLPVLGVRTPMMRKLASEIFKTDKYGYLENCKFEFFEDVFIYGLVIANFDCEEFLKYLPKYLERVDSWAHIDSFVPSIKCIKKNKDNFFEFIKSEIFGASGFFLRFLIVSLMDYYLEEKYLDYVFSAVERVDNRGYYNDMAIAWLISVAFVKFEGKTFDFIKNCKLSNFTLNKSISKIKDSFRVSRENKILLQNFIRKN